MSYSHRQHNASLAIICIVIISVTVRCHAFLSTHVRRSRSCTCLHLTKTDDEINRRELLESTSKIAGAITASTFIQPSYASTATATQFQTLPKSLCDPSVSTWTKSYDNTQRTVHILGTAHISSASAELAGRLVREVKPDVVFVELDIKRVKRIFPQYLSSGAGASRGDKTDSSQSDEPSNNIAAFSYTPTPKDQSSSDPSPIINLGSKYVGYAVKSMYGKLESDGFKAGDEFAMSVREGLSLGSTIVLGDRDVEVTLRRLAKALSKTDIRKLLSVDNEVEMTMNELVPESLKEQLLRKQYMKNEAEGKTLSSKLNQDRGESLSVGMGKVISEQSESNNGVAMKNADIEIDKAEFESFVETMKEKDNVKKIMLALKKTAPEIYEAMVAERDLYMAKGLDELSENLKSDAKDTVAVMGMAHVDGVESYLMSQGWVSKSYPCPVNDRRSTTRAPTQAKIELNDRGKPRSIPPGMV
jgi:pheromone shutdown protein TraB